MARPTERSRRFAVGKTFERGNSSALAHALRTLISNVNEPHAISARARAFGAANFDWDRYVRYALKLLESEVDVSCPLHDPEDFGTIPRAPHE